MPTPAPLYSEVRHVPVTASGLPIGHTEPLDPDNPLRARYRYINKIKAGVAAKMEAVRKKSSIGGAQARSLAKRAK